MRATLAVIFSGAAAIAGAQTFFDDFNRPDAANLGPNWQVIGAGSATRTIGNRAGNVAGANNLSLVTSANFSNGYATTMVEADVFHTTGAVGYAALAMGHNGSITAGNGLFIKVQANSATATGFDAIGFYSGVGSSSATVWTDPPIFFTITPSFSQGRMRVWASSPTTINLTVDTDFNGSADLAWSRNINLSTIVLGNQVGVAAFGTNTKMDNFRATVVPEPATMAALGLGVAALIRRRRVR